MRIGRGLSVTWRNSLNFRDSTKEYNGNDNNDAFTVWEKPVHSLFHSIHLTMPVKIEQKLLHSVINEELGLQKVDVILAKIKHQGKNVKSR